MEPVELSGDSAEECCQRALGPVRWGNVWGRREVKWITLCMHEYITPAAVCFPWQESGVRLGLAPRCLPWLRRSHCRRRTIKPSECAELRGERLFNSLPLFFPLSASLSLFPGSGLGHLSMTETHRCSFFGKWNNT